MLQAYSLASKVPQYLASFYKGTWDYTLYSEGFMAAWPNGFDDGKSPFISIEELIRHETLDKGYLSISEYCQRVNEGLPIGEEFFTPLELAATIQDECSITMKLLGELRDDGNEPALVRDVDALESAVKPDCRAHPELRTRDVVRVAVDVHEAALRKHLREESHAIRVHRRLEHERTRVSHRQLA